MGAHGWSDDSGIVLHSESAPGARLMVLEAPLALGECFFSQEAGQGRPAGCQCLEVVRSPLLAEAGHCIDWPGGAGLVSGLSWSRVAVLGVGGGFFGVAE